MLYYGNMSEIKMYWAEDGVLYDLPGPDYNINVIEKAGGVFEVQIYWADLQGGLGDFEDIDGEHESLYEAILHGKRYVQARKCGDKHPYFTKRFIYMDDDEWDEYLKSLPKYKEYIDALFTTTG